MISYENALNEAVQRYERMWLQPLAQYKWSKPIPTDISALLKERDEVKKLLGQVTSISVTPLSFDATQMVKEYYDKLDNQQKLTRDELISNATNKKEAMIAQHEQEVRDAAQYNKDLLKPIQEKHKLLLDKQKELDYVFKHYDISPLDMDIADDITIEEFNTLIDESIAVCDKYGQRESSLFARVVAPLKGEKNLTFTASYVAIILIVLYIATPLIAPFAFYLLFKNVHNMYKDLEKLRIASALTTQLDYNRFIPKESFKTVEDIDVTVVDETLNEQLSQVTDYSGERQDAMNRLAEEQTHIARVCNDSTTKVRSQYVEVCKALNEVYNQYNTAVDNYMKDYKKFPTVQSDSVVMSHSYALGTLSNTVDIRAEVPCKNIVFDDTDRDSAIDLMKLYLANALLSVRVKQLTIEIYDPKNMCKEFTEFFTPETAPYIKPNAMKLEELIKTYRKYSQDNIISLDNTPIDEFNRIAEEKEIVPKEYRLLLIISEFEKQLDGENAAVFREYFKFSAETGVMIWLLSPKKYSNSIFVNKEYRGSGTPLKYTRELGKQAVDTYVKALANYKDHGIDYVTKFGDVYIPREKWWTWDTITGIAMHYGLENGDPTRGLPMFIGDGNVHALLGGATGAGKSAAINQILISLITMYPPSELQLVYIDFKNVEAAKFTQGYNKETHKWMPKAEEQKLRDDGVYYTRVSRIPQLRIISGTTDGEYALSVFEFLMDEMARRQAIINKFGVTKVEEMREQILKNYNSEHNTPKGTWADMRRDWDWYKPNVYDKYGDLPRLLVIFDEFQVMYNPEFVPVKIIDMINGKITAITKLARAMGAHFWFTSQSMKGTMSKDTIANFSLRGALRCTEEVSNELIGNKAAATIKSKFGYMYTNDSAGQDKTANRFWRVPFLDEKDMPKYIDQLNDMLVEFNETHNYAEFYDEKILVPAKELESWYEQYDVFGDPYTFILGERANFSTNKAPVAFSLQDDGGENILIGAFDRNDMMNLTMTMVDNIKNSTSDVIFIANCQDQETHTLLDIENLVDEQFVSLSYPTQDVDEFIAALESTVAGRIDRGGPYTPMYILCIQWEKAPGVSVEQNFRVQDRFKDLLRKAPGVGVHFIFACREKGEMQRFIASACNHRIAALMPKDAMFFSEQSATKLEKLPSVDKNAGLFAIYDFGTTSYKFRIYQHTFTKKLKSREIKL